MELSVLGLVHFYSQHNLIPACGNFLQIRRSLAGNYANNVTTTICPTNVEAIVAFTSFVTENNFDFLRVYDGNNTTINSLASYTGNAIPASITSSAANGCLTCIYIRW
jgi:hypothetical protein